MEIKVDRDAFKRVSDSLRSLVEAAEKTSREINRLYNITIESKLKNKILDTSEETEKNHFQNIYHLYHYYIYYLEVEDFLKRFDIMM